MKTAGVKALVCEALDTLPAPYSEHVTDDVLFAIESNPRWRRRYDALCDELGKAVVNQWCGQWTGYALGKKSMVTLLFATVISYDVVACSNLSGVWLEACSAPR